ncbi:2-amino-4-hydroxy-6-hydroxymethyldihydropteridine diphosphokinase [Halalkalibacter hemicellulosilyticus]|uniref:2-amino-4-hydroxy-6-hydroxymethyldihydropteridine diphosphokinase n=1 Tax=Halalkalibacter hemicellulosilyticusJCM 9152 TaxID=1236971 RepID=W4QI18_9BACI|nr:2-amino-4-hydroxy-6-hydroxymethyldihydropteridine diphosphokinase [Halalkalibacter hemicellulosilyticus]GAE31775.1 2-amino-4-hydroxy-6-hydroxymethyldihydropteridine pyrophosphokinase [Halalkalibacter hemicellulosilyticusJCM 9152]
MKHIAYIALGSNIGKRHAHLEKAIDLLSQEAMIEVCTRSSIYETDPVGYEDQQSFLNMVISIRTSLTSEQLLEKMQQIERDCGRTREIKWGPRTIDLDILLYDQENMEMEHLIIPHPRMWERAFVLVPLKEIAPTLYVAAKGQTVEELYDTLPDKEGVKVWSTLDDASERFEN